MQLLEALTSSVEDVKKLVFKDTSVHEVTYLRKGDGKDILVVPTQTSCNMGCTFCHLTGLGISATNLASTKILELIQESLKFQPPSNKTLLVSFMGAGEPLLNVDQVIGTALALKTWPGYETVRFAVATILPSRKRFDQFKQAVTFHSLPFKLHLSLHSLDAQSRRSLMPSASPIAESWGMLAEYAEETGQPTEVHYTLIHGVNDREEDLIKFGALPGRAATIKLLRFAEKKQEPTMQGSQRTPWFKTGLESLGFKVEVYSPPGRDIGSSCGQFIVDQYVS